MNTQIQLKSEGIEDIKNMALAASEPKDIGGKTYITNDFKRAPHELQKEIKFLQASSLTSLIDYVDESLERAYYLADGITEPLKHDVFIQIHSPEKISVYTPLYFNTEATEVTQRVKLFEANLDNYPEPFNFDQMMSKEKFIIGVLSKFINDKNRKTLLDCCKKMKLKSEMSNDDDLNTSRLSAKKGVYCCPENPAPGVPNLKPFRSFREIEQVEVPLLFRYEENRSGGIDCGLIEADGGAWKLKAMEKIAEYLRGKLPDTQILC